MDSRSDVFSFGVMLYELATGNRPFRGTTTISTLAKIIEAEPEPIPETRTDVPQELRRIIARCLRKKPEERYNDTRDLVAALKELRQETTSTTARIPSVAATRMPARRKLGARLLWAACGLVAVSVAVYLVARSGPRPAKAVAPVHRQITFTGTARDPVVSPDGQFVAYVERAGAARARLMVQDLAGGNPLAILEAHWVREPHWSPDGSQVYVQSTAENGGRADYLVPRLGGAPQSTAKLGQFVAWSPDGKRLATLDEYGHEITITNRVTGEERKVGIDAKYTWLEGLDWSPATDLFAFGAVDENGRLDLWTIAPDRARPIRIAAGITYCMPRFSPRGDALYYLSSEAGSSAPALFKVKIDRESGSPAGEPSLVLSGLEVAQFVGASFTISRDGKRLVYARATIRSNLFLADLDPKAEGGVGVRELTSGTSRDDSPRFSPDGRSIAFVRNGNVFVLPLDGGTARQLTFGSADYLSVAWSPDGREIAFVSEEAGNSKVWRIAAGGGVAQPFANTASGGSGLSWAPGRMILYQKPGNRNLIALDPTTGRESSLLKDESSGWLFDPRSSPDATKVAMFWNREPKQGAWVASLDGTTWRRLGDDSSVPSYPLGWSADGAWVYSIAADELSPRLDLVRPSLVRSPARGGPAIGVAKLPFQEVARDPGGDMTRDGRRFVFAVPDVRSDVWLIENFDPDLRRE